MGCFKDKFFGSKKSSEQELAENLNEVMALDGGHLRTGIALSTQPLWKPHWDGLSSSLIQKGACSKATIVGRLKHDPPRQLSEAKGERGAHKWVLWSNINVSLIPKGGAAAPASSSDRTDPIQRSTCKP